MRKILLISAAAVFVCAIISVTLSSLGTAQNTAAAENMIFPEKGEQVYVLKEYKGLVAVFKEDGDVPVKITQTHVQTLPPYDAQRLEDGITVEGEENLQKILMDFCS